MNILLTGGMGYIGSHAAVSLIENGDEVYIFDNLINSSQGILDSIFEITKKKPIFIEGDIKNTELLIDTFSAYEIESVIHFAGLKAVSESVSNPLLYFNNNICGTISLLEAMEHAKIYNLVFSSSATVYGAPSYLPIDELHSINALNPYGRTKQHIEEILRNLASSDSLWKIVNLRYFNPIGAHPSGKIGENVNGLPSNIMPLICKTVTGELPRLQIYGNDYDTPDGTGIRDYIDIMDLVDGHIAALQFITSDGISAANTSNDLDNFYCFNLGTGFGYSVLELITTFERVSGASLPYEFASRRPGDIAACYADVSKAKKFLGWVAKRSLEEMCQGTWNFIQTIQTIQNK